LRCHFLACNALTGWQQGTFGYHEDDGNTFRGSGFGEDYGPTFTTGDVIGCALNVEQGACVYTKNGISLGVAFTDLPDGLYPAVGLASKGAIIEVNFGQKPFMFDIQQKGELIFDNCESEDDESEDYDYRSEDEWSE